MTTPDVCAWAQDGEDSDAWGTSCGHFFRLEEGTPADNGMKFCWHCGKPCESVPWVEDEGEST
jgi:hypothetical protein